MMSAGHWILITVVIVLSCPSSHCQTSNGTNEYDFIVVGGGSAGSVVASRLSENPQVRVLLLEAGGHETLESNIPQFCHNLQLTDLDWQYKTEPQANACLGMLNNQSLWPRGKVLGGSSSINYMLYIRGNMRDYDRWASLGNTGWSWNDVLPYFLKSEDNTSPWLAGDSRNHRSGGPLTISEVPYRSYLANPFMEATAAQGYPTRDINGDIQTGTMPVITTTIRGRRNSAAKAFLKPAENRTNLEIVTGAMVLKVLINGSKQAYGVIYQRQDRNYTATVSREVILSAGSVATPQLLMLSGIGPRQHLQSLNIPVIQDSPGVGQNLQDHIFVSGMVWNSNRRVPTELNSSDVFFQWERYGIGPLTSIGGMQGVINIKTRLANQSDDWPDAQIAFFDGGVLSDGGAALRFTFGFSNETWDQYYAPFVKYECMTMVPFPLRPKSRGEIRLRSTDPYDHPIIDPKYLSDEEDLRVLVEACKFAMALGNDTVFQQLGMKFIPSTTPGCEQFLKYSDQYWACLARHQTSTVYHPVGTAKMGPSQDRMAVVDPELRVYGVRGLRVIDGSVMPYITSGNTNAPIMMIGEKGADLIKRTLSST